MIEKIEIEIPKPYDSAPGTPGNTFCEDMWELRKKINEIIENVNKLEKGDRT